MAESSPLSGTQTESGREPNSRFETRVAATPFDDERRILKHADTFAVFDRHGDIHPLNQRSEGGIYHRGTRYLSEMHLAIDGAPTLLLNSAVDEEQVILSIDLTNSSPRLPELAAATLHIHRGRLLLSGVCQEEITLTNYSSESVRATLSLHFGADFADVFEVRGVKRSRRGRLTERGTPHGLVFCYEGLDGARRETQVETDPPPDVVRGRRLDFRLQLGPRASQVISLRIACRPNEGTGEMISFETARKQVTSELHTAAEGVCRIRTSNEHINAWFSRSFSDLMMMITATPQGLYPYAGVPWYSTIFGRDGLITALECLWMMPQLARGVLAFLAAHQADRRDREKDCQPGKILHEMREGEMAALGEVPFGLYYGSVDATPLFVHLAGEYLIRTGDLPFVAELWPHVERALDWMSDYGDVDGDGFIEYARESSDGLVHQGWKDSHDCIFHADGSEPAPPIALCEVQAYAYAACRSAATAAQALGYDRRALDLRDRAGRLRSAFHEAFWLEKLGTFALALDGRKRPCEVRSSNAGQCLFSGIAEPWQAERVARTLLDGHHYCGWGIRTLDEREPRFNPMSYHNGSVWPHDNALIAAGFARYNLCDEANRLFSDLFQASLHMDLHRLPELFCGFPRRRAQGPTLYPVACSPQTWASAAAFQLLQACLGLRIDALENRITFCGTRLPPMLEHVSLFDLRVGSAGVDVRLNRFGDDVGSHVIRKDGKLEVVMLK